MQALVLTDVATMPQQTVAKPTIGVDEVLIQTQYAGICGTDHALYQGLPGSAKAQPPIILGHENSGIVTAIGDTVTNVKVGQRVTVDPNIYCGQCEYCRTGRPELCDQLAAVGVTRNGGLAEYFSAPASVVYHLPDTVSLEAGATVEPLSCAVHGLELLHLRPYQKALVIGDGFMGQLFVQLLQAYGVQAVTLAGIVDEKLALNQQRFHVDQVINTTKASIPSIYDVVIEAVGRPETQAQAVQAARKGGQVLMFGVGQPDAHFAMNTYDIFQKQLTIQGSFINPHAFDTAIALLASGKVDVLPLISHVLRLDQVAAVLDGQITGISKAVVKLGN